MPPASPVQARFPQPDFAGLWHFPHPTLPCNFRLTPQTVSAEAVVLPWLQAIDALQNRARHPVRLLPGEAHVCRWALRILRSDSAANRFRPALRSAPHLPCPTSFQSARA